MAELNFVLNYPALSIVSDSEKTLVIADLHIGFEFELSKMGVGVPSQVPRLRHRLLEIIGMEPPDRLLILGDIKHSVPEIPLQEWEMIPTFFEEICSVIPQVGIIPGNHDGNVEPLLPREVKLLSPRGVKLENIALLHGHAWPSPHLLSAEWLIIGHNHPTIKLVDRAGFRVLEPVWLRLRLDGSRLAKEFLRYRGVSIGGDPRATLRERFEVEVRDSILIVMPSFNDMLGGAPVNTADPKEMLGPLLGPEVADINQAEVYLVDGTLLGSVGQLRDLAKT